MYINCAARGLFVCGHCFCHCTQQKAIPSAAQCLSLALPHSNTHRHSLSSVPSNLPSDMPTIEAGKKAEFPDTGKFIISVSFLHFSKDTSCFLKMDRANFCVHFPVPFLQQFCRTSARNCTGNCTLSGFAGYLSCI